MVEFGVRSAYTLYGMSEGRRPAGWQGLATLLRAARRRAHLTPTEVSNKLNIRRAAIYEIERGTRRVSADELHQFAELYSVSAAWLSERASSRARDDRAELAAQVLAGMSQLELDRLSKAIEIVRERRGPLLNMYGRRDWVS
jgi:transcriptional regulator with XRE-family HTH domain